MKLSSKYMLVCAVIFVVAPIFLSTISSDNITATDWTYRHLPWIEQYIKGNLSPLADYPPLFHWLLLPIVAIAPSIVKYFQVVFAIVAIVSILYYAYRKEGDDATVLTAILLASSIAFVEFAGSLMPQALDYALFPLACLFYYQHRVKLMSAALLAMFFMHGTGFVFIGVLVAHSLITRKKEAFVLMALLVLTAPLFYYWQFASNYTTTIANVWDMESQRAWEQSYLTPWWKFFAMSGFLTWILLPYAVWKLYKHRFKLSDSQILYIVWIGVFLLLIPFNQGIWRAISYQIVPLSLFVASVISNDKQKECGDNIPRSASA